MKQKINLQLIFVAILAVITTTFCITLVYYNLFQGQVKKDLHITADLLADAGIAGIAMDAQGEDEEEIRITWIASDGSVIYDNDVLADNLSNHMDRPEVKEAFLTGTGESVRESDTMNMKTFYYALLLSDGTVLRVAMEARSIGNVFVQTFPIVFVIILFIVVLCVLVSQILTKQLIKPIKEMAENMDHVSVESAYRELTPFIDRIREQHENILMAAKSRQDFTANVSHELKTPLTAISGYAELIQNKMADEEQQIKFAGEIRRHSERLVSLVNDIIRLSELDHKESLPEFLKIDLYEVAQERIELLKNNGREKNIKVSLSGEHCMVTSNQRLLMELIDNLVQNAIRYNVANGLVQVSVLQKDNYVELKVSDTGIGIPKADQGRVFERFYRVDKSRSRDTGGTGLGLAIVKHIVELHDGEIELSSEVGKGTEIVVKL